MKRMYVTLLILGVLLAWALTSLAQIFSPSHDERQLERERRTQMHLDLHQKLRESMFSGSSNIDQIFKDFEEAFHQEMESSFSRISQFSSPSYSQEWQESKDGRTLRIKPKDKEQKLSIDVQDGMISIKGESENSQFTNSFNVPHDCDASQVKMSSENGEIVLFMPYRVKLKEERRPLKAGSEDVQV